MNGKLSIMMMSMVVLFGCAIVVAQPQGPSMGPNGKGQAGCPYAGNPGYFTPGPPPPPMKIEEIFKSADKNADGCLDLEEFKSVKRKVHTPGRGTKSRFELERRGQGIGKVGKPDADIPERDVQARRQQKLEEMFKRIDKDGDGKISLDEFKAFPPPVPPRRPVPPFGGPGPVPPIPPRELGPQGHTPGMAPQGTPRRIPSPGGKWISEALREADKDNDGEVTFDELRTVRPNMTEERFKFMDVNNDGVITREDLEKWREKAKEKFQEADVDKDGKVSREEIRRVFPRMSDEAFQRKDLNGDGFLTPDELRSGIGPKR
ncbi:MAG: EF-hand domain-containing protein [Candidatus Hydrogenedentes bacterium]|nr:EF-hand domain-containing protein [Candidatus Hydrogenedentota bacterium]